MKVDVNRKGRRRRKPQRFSARTLNSRVVWEIVRWLLILTPRVIQFIEWLRS